MVKTPNLHTTPGKLIKDELLARHISQKDFAKALGVGAPYVNDLLSGRRRLTLSLAQKTEELLGISSQVLMDLQAIDSGNCNPPSLRDATEIEANAALSNIDSFVSVRTLLKPLKRKFRTNVDRLAALREYYGLTSENVATIIGGVTKGCYRKSSVTGMDKRMITSWVLMANAVSETVKPSGFFSISRMDELCHIVVRVLHNNRPGVISNLIELLSQYGIGLLRVDKVERASIDGYSFYNNGIPYIALTCRYDRIDNLAFTLLHELAHIRMGHTTVNRAQLNIDSRSYDEDYNDSVEEQANRFASEALIPSEIWRFAPTVLSNPSIIKARYTQWAHSKNLNPWIVLGRLSYETGIYKFPADESRKINGGKEVCHELIR